MQPVAPRDVPAISLIICTRNRAQQLSRTLLHVGRIRFEGPWELIIVDNGSSDETVAIVDAFAASAPFDVRLVRAPLPGLSRARNLGISHARGRILCFTDDDCYPAENHLAEVERVFANESVAFMGGRVLLFDPSDARVTLKESTQGRVFLPGDMIPAGAIHGANMAFRRSVLDVVHGFDVLLGAGAPLASGEDIDFLSSLSAAGFQGCYAPGPTVHHHHGRKSEEDVQRLRDGHALGRGAVYFKGLFRARTSRAYASYWLDIFRRGASERVKSEAKGAMLYCLWMARARLMSTRP